MTEPHPAGEVWFAQEGAFSAATSNVPVLHYYPARGRAEPIRLALALVQQPWFEPPAGPLYDVMKRELDGYPFRQMPRFVDEVNAKVDIVQSMCVCQDAGLSAEAVAAYTSSVMAPEKDLVESSEQGPGLACLERLLTGGAPQVTPGGDEGTHDGPRQGDRDNSNASSSIGDSVQQQRELDDAEMASIADVGAVRGRSGSSTAAGPNGSPAMAMAVDSRLDEDGRKWFVGDNISIADIAVADLMRAYRKDIADLLRAGKQDYARIRVEAVIREGLTLTAYEILELYLELLAVRSSLVASSKDIPRDMVEALSSVLYAASREYVAEACSDAGCARWSVNDSLRRCLTVEPPEAAVKLETLSEIAQTLECGVTLVLHVAVTDATPGCVEDTAEEVTRRGGTGIAVICDHTDSQQVAALFERVAVEQQGRLDLLVNAAWGGIALPINQEPFRTQPLERVGPGGRGAGGPDGGEQLKLKHWENMFTAGVAVQFSPAAEQPR
eukprot:gene12906-13032_t